MSLTRRGALGLAALRPALMVYYLGVPDTTPEFASEAGLRAYLDDAVAKARPAAGRPAP